MYYLYQQRALFHCFFARERRNGGVPLPNSNEKDQPSMDVQRELSSEDCRTHMVSGMRDLRLWLHWIYILPFISNSTASV